MTQPQQFTAPGRARLPFRPAFVPRSNVTMLQSAATAGTVSEIRHALLQAVSMSGVAVIVGSTAAVNHGQLIVTDSGSLAVSVLDVLEVAPDSLPADVVSREAEMAWVRDHLSDFAADHAGEWIALDGSELIALGKDLSAVLARAAGLGHPHPFVTVVPVGPDVPFIG
jgi:hypothetical protein